MKILSEIIYIYYIHYYTFPYHYLPNNGYVRKEDEYTPIIRVRCIINEKSRIIIVLILNEIIEVYINVQFLIITEIILCVFRNTNKSLLNISNT